LPEVATENVKYINRPTLLDDLDPPLPGEGLMRGRYLKRTAVTPVIPKAPSYSLTAPYKPCPTTRLTSASRSEEERRQLTTMETSFAAKDGDSVRSLQANNP